MNQQKKDGQPGSQFDSGFGGSMFGGNGQSSQFNPGAGGTNAGGPPGGGAGGGGDFASGFGGTNAVSQIFKEGGFAADEKKKKMLIFGSVALVAVALGAVYFMFMGGEETPVDPAATTEAPKADAAASAAAEGDAAGDAAGEEDVAAEEDGEGVAEDEAEATAEAPAAGAAPAAAPVAMGGSSSYTYDEEKGGPVVSAPAGTMLEVARKADFSDAYVIGKVGASGQFRIPNPPPGNVYWRAQGSQSGNEIAIAAPASLGVSFSGPGTLANGASLSWSASGPVAYYRVEFATDANFSSVAHVISTSQTSAAVKDVTAGKYFVRLGGFNRASGKWEYSSSSSVEVQ